MNAAGLRSSEILLSRQAILLQPMQRAGRFASFGRYYQVDDAIVVWQAEISVKQSTMTAEIVKVP